MQHSNLGLYIIVIKQVCIIVSATLTFWLETSVLYMKVVPIVPFYLHLFSSGPLRLYTVFHCWSKIHPKICTSEKDMNKSKLLIMCLVWLFDPRTIDLNFSFEKNIWKCTIEINIWSIKIKYTDIRELHCLFTALCVCQKECNKMLQRD